MMQAFTEIVKWSIDRTVAIKTNQNKIRLKKIEVMLPGIRSVSENNPA